MTTQNETMFSKITQLEKDVITLKKALLHTESLRSSAEQDNHLLIKWLSSQGLQQTAELFLRQESSEEDVKCFTAYIGTKQDEQGDEYDNQGHRSLEEHRERQEAYNAFKEDL